MFTAPHKPRRRIPLSKYWPVSIVILVILFACGILAWSFSPTFASDKYSHHDSHPFDDNPPYAIGPTGSERLGGGNPSEINSCNQCAGDPVDTFSGNFSETFTDFSIPGRGVPLLFTRTYNAQSASQNSILGYGWSDSYNMFLNVFNTVFQENGSTVSMSSTPPRVLASLFYGGGSVNTFLRYQTQIRYNFNFSGYLVSEVDRNGYTTTLTYNTNNQLVAVTDPAGRALTLVYNSAGQIASITDPDNRTVSYAYDSNGNLISVTDVNGGITKFTYDANHLMLTITDPNGGVLTSIYDSSSRVTSQTDAMGRTTTFSYGTNSTTITDPNGNVTVDNYQRALLASETKGFGTSQAATWTYAYNPYCNGLSAITDPNGHTWFQTWDVNGNKLSVTDPGGRITKYTYDNLNDLTSTTDPKGVTTTLAYDSKGNLLSISTPLTGTTTNRKTTFTYGDTTHPGDVTAIIDPDSNSWNYTYDASGDLTGVTDPLHNATTSQYNSIGWQTAQITALGHTTSYTYNNFGDVTLVTDPQGHKTTLSYDANRNLTIAVDAAGNTTRYTYDLDNELSKITRADGSTLSYTYDNDGNQTVYTDGLGHTTGYTYGDAAFPHNNTAITDALNRTTSYSYDLAGNATSLKNPAGQTTTYTYDAANELTGITYSDGKTPGVSYTYDADGQRIKMTDGTGSTTYAYDSLNRLTQSTSGAGNTVTYGYDLKGQILSLTYPGSLKVARTYDASGRLKTITDWLNNKTTFGYDADSNLTSETYPNGIKATFKYDHNDQVTSISDALGSTQLLSFTYTRNNLSLLASMSPTGVPQSSETYSYTALNQLSTVNQPTYQYDHGDNLTQIGTSTLTYDAANELKTLVQTASTTTFTYDTQGNLVKQKAPNGTTTKLTYDQANRLTAYGTSATYTYNGDGLRMSKTVSGTAEAFTWDVAEGLPQLLQDGTTLYVYGPGGLPLEQVNSSTVLYYHQDQLGSTRALTNSTGTVVATYGYDAYGNITGTTGSVTNPFQYAGQYTDAESGLQYMHARYYDPAIGQFISRDPLVTLTRQAYGYTGGDPINRTDRSGLDTGGICLSGSVFGGFGGLGEVCLVGDTQGNIGITTTAGVGGGEGASAGITFQISNAQTVYDLKGGFNFAGGSVGVPLAGVPVGAGYQVSWGQDSQHRDVVVHGITIGLESPGPGWQAGKSCTVVSNVKSAKR